MSAGIIAASYVATPSYSGTVLADTPSAYWRMGETAGALWLDYSGNGRNVGWGLFKVLGQPSLIPSDPVNLSAFLDEGDTSYPNSSWMDTNYASGEVWVKFDPAQITRQQFLLGRDFWSGTNELGWQIDMVPSPPRFRGYCVTTAAPSTFQIVTSGTVAASTAYHVVFTYDGAFVRLYVNGVSVGTPVSAPGVLQKPAQKIIIGGTPATTNLRLTGYLDEVAVYGYALSAAQVAAHYAAAQ